MFVLVMALTCIREFLLQMDRFLFKSEVTKSILFICTSIPLVCSSAFNPRLVRVVELNELKRSFEDLRHFCRTRLDTRITAPIGINSFAKLPVTVPKNS